jgi:hypothetical protein
MALFTPGSTEGCEHLHIQRSVIIQVRQHDLSKNIGIFREVNDGCLIVENQGCE